MKFLIAKLKKRNKIIVLFFLFTMIAFLTSIIYFIQNLLNLNGIEDTLRYFLIALLTVSFVFFVFYNLVKIVAGRYKKSIFLNTLVLFITFLMFGAGSLIDVLFESISSVGESSTLNYTTKLINLTSSEFTEDSVIGIIEDESDIEGFVLANSLIEQENLSNEIVYYETYYKMLNDLLEGDIDAAFVKNNYVSLYSSEESFEDIADLTTVLYSLTEELDNDDIVAASEKSFDEPITILILGVDSETDGLNDASAFNGDTIMMVTFNPDTLNATMFSIPRDIMVPIACNNNSVAKINSSAAGGTSCVINTVTNLTGIDIDYYVKINFKGVVDLVDALDGIELYVEEPDYNTYNGQICEQNSDREFGSSLICIDSGYQKLTGEEALAYARNRKLYSGSDIDRIAHQQDIIEAIAQKALTISSYSEFEGILSAVENNIVTNMSTDQMLSAYTVFKDVIINALNGDDLINIEKSYLEYYDLRVYMPSYGMETAGLGYYQSSLDDIIEMMEINLELQEPDIIKSFSYELGETYESSVAGEGYTTGLSYQTLTDFTGYTYSEAVSYCSSKGITCSFVTVDSNSSHYNTYVSTGLIGDQSVTAKTLLQLSGNVTLYINGEYISSEEDDLVDDNLVENNVSSDLNDDLVENNTTEDNITEDNDAEDNDAEDNTTEDSDVLDSTIFPT